MHIEIKIDFVGIGWNKLISKMRIPSVVVKNNSPKKICRPTGGQQLLIINCIMLFIVPTSADLEVT